MGGATHTFVLIFSDFLLDFVFRVRACVMVLALLRGLSFIYFVFDELFFFDSPVFIDRTDARGSRKYGVPLQYWLA